MSQQPGGKKGGGGKGGKKSAQITSLTSHTVKEPTTAANNGHDEDKMDAGPSDSGAGKDDNGTSKNGDDKTNGTDTPQKPQSAGAVTRDGAQKVLALCQKGEWTPVDNALKALEKAVAAAGEEANLTPLAGVADSVCIFKSHTITIKFKSLLLYIFNT